MVDIMRQELQYRASDVVIKFKDDAEREAMGKTGESMITYCLKNDRIEEAKRIVLNQVALRLYGDLLHFVYEGLVALEKRKYTVAFALLRKPLKYNLMFATWVFADENDFFDRLRKAPAEMLTEGHANFSKARRLELLQNAISQLPISEFLDAEVIYQAVYERRNHKGLAPYFDMATHLATSFEGIKTDSMNLNFTFKDPNDTEGYEGVYFPIAYLLVYLILLQLEIIGRMTAVAESYKGWLITAMFGTMGSLFEMGSEVVGQMNQELREFLKCGVCGSELVVTQDNAPRFFMSELIDCPKCGIEQQFPLFWLMTSACKTTVSASPVATS